MKHLSLFVLLACLLAFSTVPASALEYSVDAPVSTEFASPTSVETVITADGGERANEDLSKNNPVVAPAFGSNTSYLPGSGEPLYPFLNMTGVGQAAQGAETVPIPSTTSTANYPTGGDGVFLDDVFTYGFTEVTSNLYYSGGYLGRLKIPSLNVNVKIYQGTDSAALAKGAGHFEDTSIWEGNCCIAGHNRGANCYFGEIHTLKAGDIITLTTKLGTRTYAVTSVSKVLETDTSMLAPTVENCVTLFTCVRNQSAYRWCVRAVAVG